MGVLNLDKFLNKNYCSALFPAIALKSYFKKKKNWKRLFLLNYSITQYYKFDNV